jgi:hypothetical protein
MPKYPARTYENIDRDRSDYEYLRNKLKLKQLEEKDTFTKKYPHVVKFFKEKGVDFGKLREHSSKVLSAGALTGSLVLSLPTGVSKLPVVTEIIDKVKLTGGNLSVSSLQKLLLDSLSEVLPDKPRTLTVEEEKAVEQIFSQIVGVKAKANLGGEHLNTTYGYIGAEQHLRRYPGDTLANHGTGEVLDEGIAPGLGAWGYFASSQSLLSQNLVETEKWYAVVQTLYLPDWNTRQPYLRDWYKYRKVLIVNTDNGNAVVAAIADSGPAAWTGKQFGGSPEVMDYLGGSRYKKGAVLVFFVDDPENKIPLGPVDYNKITLPENITLSS